MSLFSRKSTFLVGSLIGSAIGLLFARESGKTLRGKLTSSKTPQKKFEALFEEYLKIGKEAIAEAQKSEAIKELIDGGKEILAELKEKAKKDSGSAMKFAQKKANEVIKEMEKQAGKVEKKAVKKISKAKKSIVKKTTKVKKSVRRVSKK
jgi:gas vesicle protein